MKALSLEYEPGRGDLTIGVFGQHYSVWKVCNNIRNCWAQFEFLGHLRPRGFRDVGKVECHVFILEVCEGPFESGEHSPRVSLFERQVSHDLERGFEPHSVITVRFNQAIEVGSVPFRGCEFVRQRVYLHAS